MNFDEVIGDFWRYDLVAYARQISGGEWVAYNWLKKVLPFVQSEIEKGNARIIINAPPRHGKSESISHYLPAWFIDLDPTNQVILTSYGDSLATDWGRKVRDEFRDNDLTWANVRSDKDAANDWQTTEGGGMRTAGVGGADNRQGRRFDNSRRSFQEFRRSQQSRA